MRIGNGTRPGLVETPADSNVVGDAIGLITDQWRTDCAIVSDRIDGERTPFDPTNGPEQKRVLRDAGLKLEIQRLRDLGFEFAVDGWAKAVLGQ